MQDEKVILFLYTRLPDYTYQCIQYFVSCYACRVVIVRYRPDFDTRYTFDSHAKVDLYYKEDVDIDALINRYNPAVVIASGWSDKTYVEACQNLSAKVPVVLGLDNPWVGNLKQQILCLLSKWYVRRAFRSAWVPGWSQFEYARRLGFKKNNIFSGLYCADTEKFYTLKDRYIKVKSTVFPRTVVYVGRMVEYKQPHTLARVFSKVVSKCDVKWKLLLAGEGPLKEDIVRKNYAHVEVLDFLSPKDIPHFYENAGIFCLPSIEEHWGVAVHEATAAGLPLLLSDSVESGTQFLINGYNGFQFRTGDENAFENALSRFMAMSDNDLFQMASNSLIMSNHTSHAKWAATLNNFISS